MLQFLGQPHPELGAQRAGDLVSHEGAEAAVPRVDAAHQLTRQPAVGECVVAVRGARFPQRRLFGETAGDRGPVERVRKRDRRVDAEEAGLVREQLGDGDIALSSRRELGPVRRHLLVVVEQPAVHAHADGDCRDTFRGGEHELQRVVRVRGHARTVEEPAPQVHDQLAAVVHGNARAHIAT